MKKTHDMTFFFLNFKGSKYSTFPTFGFCMFSKRLSDFMSAIHHAQNDIHTT